MSSPNGPAAYGQLDAADPSSFADVVGPLFERAPAFLASLAAARPFGDWERLLAAARRIAHEMPEADQIELIDAHPRLGAAPTSMSSLSRLEQGAGTAADGDDDRVARELDDLNRRYEGRFGFRYCVWVAGRSRAALLPEMAAALDGARDAELHRAIDAVIDIAADRLRRAP